VRGRWAYPRPRRPDWQTKWAMYLDAGVRGHAGKEKRRSGAPVQASSRRAAGRIIFTRLELPLCRPSICLAACSLSMRGATDGHVDGRTEGGMGCSVAALGHMALRNEMYEVPCRSVSPDNMAKQCAPPPRPRGRGGSDQDDMCALGCGRQSRGAGGRLRGHSPTHTRALSRFAGEGGPDDGRRGGGMVGVVVTPAPFVGVHPRLDVVIVFQGRWASRGWEEARL
jgi:hypothetical protein